MIGGLERPAKWKINENGLEAGLGWSGLWGRAGPTLGKIERKDNGPQGGLGPKQRIKKMGCINGFRIYFKDLSSKKSRI
jgi:hypothetical protein